jgi:CDP-diacylglycerol--glycerol-3-phosphate 3-phosphatidyltransferase
MNAWAYIRQNATIPNGLTLIRLLLAPVYIILFVRGLKIPALAVFLAACFTDLLDGYLARKLDQITNFGKLVDPFADKVTVLTAMFSMALGNAHIPAVIPWLAVAILLLKECVMVVGGLIMLKHGIVVYSSMIGKVAHSVFIGALATTFFHDELSDVFPTWPMSLDLMFVWLAVALTLYAMIFYILHSVQKARALGIIGSSHEPGPPQA